MCGFVGILAVTAANINDLEARVTRMAHAIRHRGPDDAGAWADVKAGIALGHQRLSILDLSPAGHQPMHAADQRRVIAFNGEIYNHLALRAALETEGAAPAWRGHSDTETLLAAFGHWGLDATLGKTVGMFALALWDKQERTLVLARDRFGEKPLYYGWAGGAFLFGSELKALRAYPGFDNPVCRQALAQYLGFMYVPAPLSIYRNIYKLEPGCLLQIQGVAPGSPPTQALRPPASYHTLSLRRWWSLADAVVQGAQQPLRDEQEALQALEQGLQEAVRLQSLADVPLGAFLSGGVDSSTIVALMQQQSMRPVQTFTIGFHEKSFDESPYAAAVARHLGTEHAELRVSAQDTQAVIPLLPAMYDEPFADSSQIPTHLVCRVARQHVTVALSGDAGDELFGGYNRYFWGPRIWNRLAWLPYPLRMALGAAITTLPPSGWDVLGRPLNLLRSGTGGIACLGQKAHKLAARLHGLHNLDDLYRSLVTEWPNGAQLVLSDTGEPLPSWSGMLEDPLPAHGVDEAQLRMMYRDSMTYLPDDILCKVDRAAMAVSLETRVPFLDHRIAELAWRLPLDMKIRNGTGKWALRQVLYKYVPRELIERPKTGFGIPVGLWLRGPLREWAENLLAPSRLQQEGFFDPKPIRLVWQQHLGGQYDWTCRLWAILMFQAWLENQSKESSAC